MRKPHLPLKCLACRNSGYIVAKALRYHRTVGGFGWPGKVVCVTDSFRVPCECAVGKRFATDAEFRKAR